MTLKDFIIQLLLTAQDLQKKGISPDKVKVCIHHREQEATGDISEICAYKNIKSDDIPYEIGLVDVIKTHDNVVIIFGNY